MSEPDPGPQPPYLEERVDELERHTALLAHRLTVLEALVSEVVTLLKEMRAAAAGDNP